MPVVARASRAGGGLRPSRIGAWNCVAKGFVRPSLSMAAAGDAAGATAAAAGGGGGGGGGHPVPTEGGRHRPLLLVPPQQMASVLHELAELRWTAQKWQVGGRYGVRVRKVGLVQPQAGQQEQDAAVAGSAGSSTGALSGGGREDRAAPRGIPITDAAAAAMTHDPAGVAAAEQVPAWHQLAPQLHELLTSGRGRLYYEDADSDAQAEQRSKQHRCSDHTVHPERPIPLPAPLPAPPPAAAGGCGAVNRGCMAASPSANSSAFRFVELFAGIGGFRVGMEAIGGRCVFASEICPDAVAVYRANFGLDRQHAGREEMTDVLVGDITSVADADIPDHDILTAGFPCQPFSSLGDQSGLSDLKGRGTLFEQIVRVLRLRRPAAFLLENVPGLLRCDDGRAFSTIMQALRGAGYRVTWELVNSRCLSAQSRNRLYFVGMRCPQGQETPQETEREQDSKRLRLHVAAIASNADKLGEVEQQDASERIGGEFVFPYIPDLCLRAEDILDPTDRDDTADTRPTDVDSTADRGRHASTDKVSSIENGSAALSDSQWKRFTTDSTVWRRRGASCLAWPDSVCNAVISHYGQDISGNGGVTQLVPRPPPHNPRTFSPREVARLQGFPQSFQLAVVVQSSAADAVGSGVSAVLTNAAYPAQNEHRRWQKVLYRLIGNAVCTPIIASIGAAIVSQCPEIAAQHALWVQQHQKHQHQQHQPEQQEQNDMAADGVIKAAVERQLLGAGLQVAVAAVVPHRQAEVLRRWAAMI